VINATGVIIHTNLGRAPVSAETAAAMAAVASGYVPLEIDATTNQRGGRMDEISTLMQLLTGAERTLVVNNNAAAVLLTLSAIAAGKSVIVSRGEAVEIGGGFRIPDVLRQSGARLVEVGTTNRTYASDYAAAIGEDTAALLKVHTSNFAITGFVHSTSVGELAELAQHHGLPVIEDLGSGALLETVRFGLVAEPTIGQSLQAGASVITASGDKLLGGPQAGLIAGQRQWVERIARHPLARAVRADKTCLAGIATTLRHYARGEAEQTIPVWRMIAVTPDELRQRCNRLATVLTQAGIDAMVEPTEATIGGGSLPGQILPSWALAFRASAVDDLARRLRTGTPAVFGHIDGGRLLLDLRTVLPEQDEALVAAIQAVTIAS
jgi:L-seryl-tRNA(Ser) seleniumtransferase